MGTWERRVLPGPLTPPFASGSLVLEPQCSELSFVHTPLWKPLLWLLGELAGAGTVDTAGVPAAEAAAMGLSGHPGSAYARRKRAAGGQVQIVLKHADELGSEGAKEFWISAESIRVLLLLPPNKNATVQSHCRFKSCCQGERATSFT